MKIGDLYNQLIDHEILVQSETGLMINLRKLVEAKKDAEKNAIKKVPSPLKNPSPSKKYIVNRKYVNSKKDTSKKDNSNLVTSNSGNNTKDKGETPRETYLTDSSLGKKAKQTAVEPLAEKVIEVYNDAFDKSVRSYKSWIKNLSYWATEYSEDEILRAIRIASKHDFWHDKMRLTHLFRTKNPQSEPVDWIGAMLDYVPPKEPSPRDKWIEKFLRENPDLNKKHAEEICPYPVEN